MLPQTLGKYELLELIGHGASANVWRARDTLLDKEVALKVIEAPVLDPYALLEEARIQARLNDQPHIVQVNNANITDGKLVIDMEYVRGRSLLDRLREETPIPPSEALAISAQLLSALEAAHARKIVHRDVKPANILLTEDGGVKLGDFGVAQVLMTNMYADGAGTYCYMAPEAYSRRPQSDHRTDLWAAGVVLYEMLTGRLPYRADGAGNSFAWKWAVETQSAPPLSQFLADAPYGLQAVLERALHRDKRRRFQTASEFLEAIQNVGKVPEMPPVVAPLAAFRARLAAGAAPLGRRVGVPVARIALQFAALAAFCIGGYRLFEFASTYTVRPKPAPSVIAALPNGVETPFRPTKPAQAGSPASRPAPVEHLTPNAERPSPVDAPAQVTTKPPVPPSRTIANLRQPSSRPEKSLGVAKIEVRPLERPAAKPADHAPPTDAKRRVEPPARVRPAASKSKSASGRSEEKPEPPAGKDTETLLDEGRDLLEQERFAEAERRFREALAQQPDHAGTYNNLGVLYQKQQRYEEAERALKQAIRRDRKYAVPHFNLGNVYYRQGRYADALREYRLVLDLDPNADFVRQNIARAEQALNGE